MQESELRPSVIQRRRSIGLWPLVAVVPVQLLVFASLLPRQRPVVRTSVVEKQTVVVSVPMITAVPIAQPIKTPIVEGCPLPRRDAPMLTVPALDEQVHAIAPAPTNAGWVAAWNDTHIYVSYDAGASFARVLDGPGTVRAVTFDCFGHAIALRDGRIGVHDGARELWRDVAGLNIPAAADAPGSGGLLGGGPDVVVLGNLPGEGWLARIAISSDLGVTWRFHDLTDGFEPGAHYSGRQHEDGAIDVAVAIGDCMVDDLHWTRITNRGFKVDHTTIGEGSRFEIYGDIAIADHQWRRFGGTWQPFDLDVQVEPMPGPSPVVVSGNEVYRVRGGKAKLVRSLVQGEAATMDLAGRVWYLACGQPRLAGREMVDLAGLGCGADI